MYQFNFLSILNLIIGSWILFMGVFLFLIRRHTYIHLTYFTTSAWILGYGFAHSSVYQEAALFWCKFVYTAVIFIAPTMYHFVVVFWKFKKQRVYIWINYLISVGFLGILFTTPYFIKGVRKFPWGYHTIATPSLHLIFLLFFSLVYGAGLFNLYKKYKQQKQEGLAIEALRTRYFLVVYSICVIGAVDYLQDYGLVSFYPAGFIFAGTGVTVAAYAIARYKLMDINLVFRGWVVFASYFIPSSLLLIPIVFYIRQNPFLLIFSIAGLLAAAPFLYRFLLKHLQPVIDKRIFNKTVGYLEDLKKILEEESERVTSVQIAWNLVEGITKIMHLECASFFLYNKARDAFRPIAQIGLDNKIMVEPIGLPSFSRSHYFIKRLNKTKAPFIKDELRDNPTIGVVRQTMEELQAEISFPLFVGQRLIGILNLGSKTTGGMFHHEDIRSLREIIDMAEKHLFHTIFMEERASFSRKLAHDMKNLFGKAIEPTIQDLVEAKDKEEKEGALKALITQLKFLKTCLKDNFDLISILERLIKKSYTLVRGDLNRIVPGAVSIYKASYDEKGLYIKVDIPGNLPKVLVNEEDIPKVFHNLLDNALKFTEKGGVTIKAEKKRDEVLITFSDTGQGIERAELEHIFEPKAKMPDEEQKSSGLGLTIVKDIIEAHKGKIWVESEYGKATTFYFTLPITK